MTTSLPPPLLLIIAIAFLPGQDSLSLRDAIVAAEDARPKDRSGLGPLLDGVRSPHAEVQRLAVRALGRLERADLADAIGGLLAHPSPAVRTEAVNALGQSLVHGDPGEWRGKLEQRLAREDDPTVRGVVLRTLGRLAVKGEDDLAHLESVLVNGTRVDGGDAPEGVLAGATHGLITLYRSIDGRRPPSAQAIERLRTLTDSSYPFLVRRQALVAMVTGRSADSGVLLSALRDTDWQVRRLAGNAAFVQVELPGRERIIGQAWDDPHPAVRLEALRAYGRHQLEGSGCEPIARAIEDPTPRIALQAIDLTSGCGSDITILLTRLVRRPFDRDDWHRPAHALVALAAGSPLSTDSIAARFAEASVWQVRMYAARAATTTGNVELLERLADDRNPNVREAALAGLSRRIGHRARARYVDALSTGDYQLVMTAARALDGTPEPAATIPPLLAALKRIKGEKRETSRDTRLAILETLGAVGGPSQAESLRPYIGDFDPVIAARAAEILSRWTGVATTAAAQPLPRTRPPTWRTLKQLEARQVVLRMRGGGRVVIALRPFDSPTNTARFVRMVREGWFDGLTFHRVAPNFVVQGGSPHANEYSGDGPFSRDELGLESHLRGTVGISTRGRDTGDGQIFINLVDNIRLDHDYTIVGEVVQGMEEVDTFLEGATIERGVVR